MSKPKRAAARCGAWQPAGADRGRPLALPFFMLRTFASPLEVEQLGKLAIALEPRRFFGYRVAARGLLRQ